jgi:ribosomal protein S18 acetylase RimI-like enzyme
MQNITTRVLTAADAAAFAKLRLYGLRESPAAFGSAYEQARKISVEEHAKRLGAPRQQGVTIGAFCEGDLVGLGGLGREASLKQRHKAWLWGMYVHPKYRGLGIGAVLIEKLMEEARAMKGLLIVKLGVTSTTAPAIKLYKSVGFQWYGSEPKAIRVSGRFYDFEYMMIEVKQMKPTRESKPRQKPKTDLKRVAATRRKRDTVSERAQRGSWQKFDRAMAKVRDVPPLPGDEK